MADAIGNGIVDAAAQLSSFFLRGSTSMGRSVDDILSLYFMSVSVRISKGMQCNLHPLRDPAVHLVAATAGVARLLE